MTRTYYIKHERFDHGIVVAYDKVTYTDVEDRPMFHKIAALDAWKAHHKGYGKLNINSVLTVSEYTRVLREMNGVPMGDEFKYYYDD